MPRFGKFEDKFLHFYFAFSFLFAQRGRKDELKFEVTMLFFSRVELTLFTSKCSHNLRKTEASELAVK